MILVTSPSGALDKITILVPVTEVGLFCLNVSNVLIYSFNAASKFISSVGANGILPQSNWLISQIDCINSSQSYGKLFF